MPRANRGSAQHVRGVHISNVWLLTDAGGRRFLIDSGHRLERRALARTLCAAGVDGPGDLTALLLTHRHSDHAGNAAWVRQRYGCPVVSHPADAAVLTGAAPRPRLAGRGAPLVHDALCRVEDRYPATCDIDDTFDAGTWRWGFEVIHVGGHTEGSVLLFHAPSGTLFTGDALLAGPPAQRLRTSLRLAVPAYSLDVDACHRATLRYLESDPPVQTLCAGHGPRVRRGIGERLRRLRTSA